MIPTHISPSYSLSTDTTSHTYSHDRSPPSPSLKIVTCGSLLLESTNATPGTPQTSEPCNESDPATRLPPTTTSPITISASCIPANSPCSLPPTTVAPPTPCPQCDSPLLETMPTIYDRSPRTTPCTYSLYHPRTRCVPSYRPKPPYQQSQN
jgi:hypothetical protein